MVTYNDVDYFYVYNLQGDVVALIDANGTQVVEYVYDAWFGKNVEIIDDVHLVRLPYLLIYREYEKACKIMTRYRIEEEHAYEKIQIKYKCEFDKIKEMLPIRFKTYKEFGELISAINEKNDDKIMGILNQWKTESYNAIEKRSKMFIRKYPIVLFHY